MLGGIASISLGLSTVWTEARSHGVSLEPIVREMSESPARLAGLSKRQEHTARVLAPSLFSCDPHPSFPVDGPALPCRHTISPFGKARH